MLRTFINSSPEQKTFEETILSMDAVIVGGGSAGSLCWFNGGMTDSRPIKRSLVECLGFIRTSHCPHYHSEPTRRPLYQEAILSGKLGPGYACDDNSHTYFLSVVDGKIKEYVLPAETIK